ncbi:hypothetical protein SDC9_209953 [bioreactor metagenome]|uniref:Uncharacterized protein n=1 Tax=bioreactor metagenome TaxID=1076179 RepID=A0A645JFF2_9ZZZZ
MIGVTGFQCAYFCLSQPFSMFLQFDCYPKMNLLVLEMIQTFIFNDGKNISLGIGVGQQIFPVFPICGECFRDKIFRRLYFFHISDSKKDKPLVIFIKQRVEVLYVGK